MTRKINALLISILLLFPSSVFSARIQNSGAASAGSVAAAGADGNVQYNNGGILGGESTMDYDDATNTLTISTLTASNRIVLPAGSVSEPSLTTTGDLNTGAFFSAADTINFVVGATTVTHIESGVFQSVKNGASSWKILNNATNATELLARTPGDEGYGSFTIDATQIIFQLSNSQVIQIFGSQFRFIDGNSSAPVLTFDSDTGTNTGFYRISEGIIGVTSDAALSLSISSAGITQPLQPSFLVTAPLNTDDVTGDGTQFTVEFDTEIRDRNSDFDTGTFTFLAPLAGDYAFDAAITVNGVINQDQTQCAMQLVTSNRTYQHTITTGTFSSSDLFMSISVTADMDVSDTASVAINCAGTTKQVDILDAATTNWFSGTLLN